MHLLARLASVALFVGFALPTLSQQIISPDTGNLDTASADQETLAQDTPISNAEPFESTKKELPEKGKPAPGPIPDTAEEEPIEAASFSMSSASSSISSSTSSGGQYFIDIKAIGTGGEFTHAVDFNLPKFRGLVPSLGLRYNSSNRSHGSVENIIGFGWDLSGLSMIERKSLGKGVPSFEEGQDIYQLDSAELLACDDNAATNPFSGWYPLGHLTDQSSASCLAGGNFTTRVESYRRILFDGNRPIWTTYRAA